LAWNQVGSALGDGLGVCYAARKRNAAGKKNKNITQSAFGRFWRRHCQNQTESLTCKSPEVLGETVAIGRVLAAMLAAFNALAKRLKMSAPTKRKLRVRAQVALLRSSRKCSREDGVSHSQKFSGVSGSGVTDVPSTYCNRAL